MKRSVSLRAELIQEKNQRIAQELREDLRRLRKERDDYDRRVQEQNFMKYQRLVATEELYKLLKSGQKIDIDLLKELLTKLNIPFAQFSRQSSDDPRRSPVGLKQAFAKLLFVDVPEAQQQEMYSRLVDALNQEHKEAPQRSELVSPEKTAFTQPTPQISPSLQSLAPDKTDYDPSSPFTVDF